MAKEQIKEYCLNLHENYAESWGVWEVARELYANAKDAAGDDCTINSPDINTLEVITPTAPDLAQLFIIGCGSKAPGGETIGQFGEGLKLAALAATRERGGSLTLRLPDQTVTFAIREHFGEQVLFADLEKAEPFDGYKCTLKMKGAGRSLDGKVIDGNESRAIPKAKDGPVDIYSRGIYITSLTEKDALFSYNLNDLKLNRDRSHAEPWSIRCAISNALTEKMTVELADTLVTESKSWESDKCLNAGGTWNVPDEARQMLADAVIRRHGEKAIVSSDPKYSEQVRNLGYKPVFCGDGLEELLAGYIDKDYQFLNKQTDLVELESFVGSSPMIDELQRLAAAVEMRGVTVAVFADQHGELLGRAEPDTMVIWMNERLMRPDNRFERIRTFIHELGHCQSGGGDETDTFERSLDLIGAKLAVKVLEQK